MEGNWEETPPNAEQLEENIASESSDGQETSEGQLSTSLTSSSMEAREKPIESNERALSGRYLSLYTITNCEGRSVLNAVSAKIDKNDSLSFCPRSLM